MNLLQSALLGAVQGLTEFLPVSSSGHLVLFQKLIPGFQQPGVLFDVFLHLGTVLAVIFFFWKKIIKLNMREWFLLGVATIPAAVVGYLLSDTVDILFANATLVSFALLVTGILNIRTDLNVQRKGDFSSKEAIVVGLFQAVAILPGISRSGSTIFAGTWLGIEKEKAAGFSFLLSVPAVLCANVLEMFKYRNNLGLDINYIVGLFCSFVFGILCIKILLKALKGTKFKYFGYYCLAVGVLTLVLL